MRKCERLINYLKSTSNLHIIIWYDCLSLDKCHADAAFSVHMDFKYHSGVMVSLHPKGEDIDSGSKKQRVNTRSSTQAELVVSDEFLPKRLWTYIIIREQGYSLKDRL